MPSRLSSGGSGICGDRYMVAAPADWHAAAGDSGPERGGGDRATAVEYRKIPAAGIDHRHLARGRRGRAAVRRSESGGLPRSDGGKKRSLTAMPERAPMIPENVQPGTGCRHLVYGGDRIIFRIQGTSVLIVRAVHEVRLLQMEWHRTDAMREGTGKTEPLKHNLSGYWSRRITDEHRIVYKVESDFRIIAQLRHRY